MNIEQERKKLERQFERLLDDPVGLDIVSKRLGLEIKNNESLKDRPIVAVLVPSYKSLHPNMLDSRTRMLHYSKQFCELFCEPIKGSSIVHWVRNDMLAPLYKEKRRFTHVLWIDDDMVFEKDVLVKMLRHDRDIVGVNYVTRSDPPKPNLHIVNLGNDTAMRITHWPSQWVKQEGDLISSAQQDWTLTCGTGMLLVRKEVLDRVGQMYVNCEYEKAFGLKDERVAEFTEIRKKACAETGNHYWFDFLPRLGGYGQSGEDTSFCLKAAMCGFKIYADVSIQPGHMGEYAYSYKDYLPYQPKELAKDGE